MGFICMMMFVCLVGLEVVRCALRMGGFVRSVGRVCTFLGRCAVLVLIIVSVVRLKVVRNVLMGSILRGLPAGLVLSSAWSVHLMSIVRHVGPGIQNGRESVCNV